MSSYSTLQDGVLGDPADLSEEYNRSLVEERAQREFIAELVCGRLLGCGLKELEAVYADGYLALADDILNSLEPEDSDPRPIADMISRTHYRRPFEELEANPQDGVNYLQAGPLGTAQLILEFNQKGFPHA